MYILKFHYDAGEVYVNIKHDGNRFIGVEQSAINPLKDITQGLLPRPVSISSLTHVSS